MNHPKFWWFLSNIVKNYETIVNVCFLYHHIIATLNLVLIRFHWPQHSNFFMKNTKFIYTFTNIVYIKLLWFWRIIGFWYIPFKYPPVISEHSWTRFPLVTLMSWWNRNPNESPGVFSKMLHHKALYDIKSSIIF